MSCFIRVLRSGVAALVAAAATTVGGAAHAQIADDFSDLNDTASPVWTHLSGLVGSTGQSWSAATGQYRLTAPNNGVALGSNGQLGFVGSYVAASLADVNVSADFVQNSTGAAYGVAARLNGSNVINSLTGYAYAYEPFAAGGLGEVVLYKITGANLTDLGSQQVTLDVANKDYKFSLDVVGTQLHGRIYEIGGGLVAEKIASDATYASGFPGLFGYSAAAAQVPTDYTVDNFRATNVPEPAAALLGGIGLATLQFVCRRTNRHR